MAREVLVEGLAPPLRMGPRVPRRRELAHSVVEVLVDRHAVIQAGVVERQRDVVLHIERAVVIGAHTGQPQSLRLITAIHTRVIDRVQPDHPLVDVGPGVIHAVIVEPQEALLLSVVPTCRPVQIQVVDPRLRRIPVIPEASQRVSGVAVTLRCIVPVVEVGQERIVGPAGEPKSWRSRLFSFSSRLLTNRTRAGWPYSALIIGPGNVPLNP